MGGTIKKIILGLVVVFCGCGPHKPADTLPQSRADKLPDRVEKANAGPIIEDADYAKQYVLKAKDDLAPVLDGVNKSTTPEAQAVRPKLQSVSDSLEKALPVLEKATTIDGPAIASAIDAMDKNAAMRDQIAAENYKKLIEEKKKSEEGLKKDLDQKTKELDAIRDSEITNTRSALRWISLALYVCGSFSIVGPMFISALAGFSGLKVGSILCAVATFLLALAHILPKLIMIFEFTLWTILIIAGVSVLIAIGVALWNMHDHSKCIAIKKAVAKPLAN